MSAHTPLHVEAQGEAGYAILDHNDNFYARTYSSVAARLIVAAPRMLDIIRALVSSPAMVDNDEPLMVEARAILRDVEGVHA